MQISLLGDRLSGNQLPIEKKTKLSDTNIPKNCYIQLYF